MSEPVDPAELLPEDDIAFLNDKYPSHIVRQVGSEIHVVLPQFIFPAAYNPTLADLLLRLPAGYPNAAPDMFWTKPDVMLTNGAWPAASSHKEVPGSGAGVEVYENVQWQRWSRHFQGGWMVGKHGLRSFVGAIIQELKKGI